MLHSIYHNLYHSLDCHYILIQNSKFYRFRVNDSYLPIWREILTILLDRCFCLSDIVKPFVSHTSPEGYLPIDLFADDGINIILICSYSCDDT